MYYSQSRIPTSVSNTRKYNVAAQKIQEASERDGDKLSPVNLDIKEALAVQLPPLVWTHYQVTPELLTVRNSGFTVMINARFGEEVPSVSGGPLNGNYSFSQVHFHWGEHDETGSGHAVDGIRYPLEMHVVHLKKDCANLGEAFQRKDGIAVMVHLFAVREERNAVLDQLTAILQFIQHPRCCARLYPTPLAEIVHPFAQDYLLYWGAVGSPSGQHRILWFISRNVLPVSTHQLEEFRQLRDPQEKFLVSNSSKPQPLAGRSLFLVSPSEKVVETMYGVSRRPTQSVFGSEESVELRDAEFKSMADLEGDSSDFYEEDNCRICPNRRKPVQASKTPGFVYRVNEGDTSVEESCIDLADNAGVTVQTEMKCRGRPTCPRVVTNVNVTTCKHKEKVAKQPSEAVYSVVSARGSELHLKRRPMIVRQNDSSQEQACVFLSRPPTYPTYNVPSLTNTGEPLAVTQEHTNLTDLPLVNNSSEIAVYNTDSEGWLGNSRNPQQPVYSENLEHYEEEVFNRNVVNSHKTKKVVIKGYDYVDENDLGMKLPNVSKQEQNPPIKDDLRSENLPSSQLQNIEEYFFEHEDETDQECSQYLLVKEIKNDKPLYKVVGKLQKGENKTCQRNLPTNNGSKNQPEQPLTQNLPAKTNNTTSEINKRYPSPSKDFAYEESEYITETEYKNKSQRKEVNKESINTYLPPKPKPTDIPENKTKTIPKFEKQDQVVLKKKKQENQEDDSHCRVSLLVRTTVSDHRRPSRKGKEYYVTKISPIENKNYVTPNVSETGLKKCLGKNPTIENRPLFYAKPIIVSDNCGKVRDINYSHMTVPPENKPRYDPNTVKDISQPINQRTEMEELYEECNEETKERKQKHTKQTIQQQIGTKNGTNQLEEPLTTAVQPKPVNKTGNLVVAQENRLDKHLTEKVNVYHKETEEGGQVHIAEKTIVGKMGKTQSTDVFANNKIIKTSEAQKMDEVKDLDYDLRKLKHPEATCTVKDSSDKDSKAVIKQQLSLDQQIKGHTQVRQTVEYHDRRKPKMHESKQNVDLSKQQNAFQNQTQTYEENKYEQSSTVKKNKLNQTNFKQNTNLVPLDNPLEINTSDIRKEKDELLNKCNVDLKQLLPGNHLEPKDLQEAKENDYESCGSNEELISPETTYNHNYQLMEQSSESKHFQHSRQQKTVIINNVNTESFPQRQSMLQSKPFLSQQITLPENKPENEEKCVNRIDPQKIDDRSKQITQTTKIPVGENTEYNEETFEENTSLSTSHKTKQKVVKTIVKGEPLYQIPNSNTGKRANNENENNELIRIPKVEIPEPHYITRLPKQPLEEFEACPVNPHQPFQIMTETFEETSSVVKTNKTFMMFKKTNVQAALPQPKVKESITDKNKPDSNNYQHPAQVKPDVSLKENVELNHKNTENKIVVPPNSSKQTLQERKPSKQQLTSPKLSESKPQQSDEQFISQYHYSETSLISEKKQMHKERKYRYFVQQPELSGIQEHIPPFPENRGLQLDEPTQNCSKNTNEIENKELGDENRDEEQSKPKIIVGSYQLKKALDSTTSPIPKPNDAQKTIEQDKTAARAPYLSSAQHYYSEEYNENSAKEQRSTKKQVISIRGGPAVRNQQIFPDNFDAGLQNPGLQEPPTKDLPQNNIQPSNYEQDPNSVSLNEEKGNCQTKPGPNRNQDEPEKGQHFDDNKTSSSMKNGTNSSLPISKTDGDIVIYIRQPRKKERVLTPKITVDVTDSHSMTRSEQEAQKVQIHEIKPKKTNERKVIKPRKSKSADIYHTALSNGSSEQNGDRTLLESSESNEEQVLDSTHYNLTLKSETQVELPEGQSARVKSKADVTIIPGKSAVKSGTNQISSNLNKKKTNMVLSNAQTTRKTGSNQDSKYADINCDQTSSFEDMPVAESSTFNQSPIRIDTKSSVVKKYPRLQFLNHWDFEGDAILENTGKTLRGSLVKENRESLPEPLLSGGPLTAQYLFYELHFHWGHKDCCGAEHIIDNQRHTLEGHYLYFKKEYKNLKTALNYEDGLAIVSVNLTVGGPPNVLLEELVKDIRLLREPETGTYVPGSSLFSWMRPALQSNEGYYSYKGSLTSKPPVVESVTWLVFPKPIVFCCQQSSEFRKLRSAKGELLTKNFRPPQPLNNRTVYYVPL